MIDENAFGVLIAYYAIEDEEYALGAERFAERVALFQRVLFEHVATRVLAANARASHFGHALYLEFPEDDILEDDASGAPTAVEKKRALLAWVRAARQTLTEHEFDTVAVVTHGGRWMPIDASGAPHHLGDVPLAFVSLPSEPLRRALFGESASHGIPAEEDAWGPGLYADTEALQALGLSPKNAPTPLQAADATYFRVSR